MFFNKKELIIYLFNSLKSFYQQKQIVYHQNIYLYMNILLLIYTNLQNL